MATINPLYDPRLTLDDPVFRIFADGDEIPTDEKVNLACELPQPAPPSLPPPCTWGRTQIPSPPMSVTHLIQLYLASSVCPPIHPPRFYQRRARSPHRSAALPGRRTRPGRRSCQGDRHLRERLSVISTLIPLMRHRDTR